MRSKYTVYAKAKRRGQLVTMHRLIMGEPTGLIVDHENHNGLDNRRSNLRVGTQRGNMANSRSRRGSSRFKGVSWAARDARWRAFLASEHISSHVSEIDAARAYDLAAVAKYGEFALTNEKLGLFDE